MSATRIPRPSSLPRSTQEVASEDARFSQCLVILADDGQLCHIHSRALKFLCGPLRLCVRVEDGGYPLAQFGKEDKPETIVPKISQETLASIVGTTRSRVSYFLNKFRRLGFIEYNGELHVHRTLLNVILYDKTPESRPAG